jgi:hypothetical protein
MSRVLRAILASGLLVFAIAVPALANDLHQTVPQGGIVAVQGTDEECGSTTVADGKILWHFVHTDTTSADLPSTLTATFSDGSSQTVNGYVNGNSIVMYDVTTVQGINLTGASDTIDNAATGGLLNLSHECLGGPPPEVPEAPIALLLPLAAIAVFGSYFLIIRRRSSSVI